MNNKKIILRTLEMNLLVINKKEWRRKLLFSGALILSGLFWNNLAWAVCELNVNGLKAMDGSVCEYSYGDPLTTTRTIDGVEYTAFTPTSPSKAVVFVDGQGSILNMNGNSYFELIAGGTRNGVMVLNSGVINVYGNLYSKTYDALNSRAVYVGDGPGTLLYVQGDLYALRSGSGGSSAVEVTYEANLLVEGDAYFSSDSHPSTHVFRNYGTSSFKKNLTLEMLRTAPNTSLPTIALRNRGFLEVDDTLTVSVQEGIGIAQILPEIQGGPPNEIRAKRLIINTTRNDNGSLDRSAVAAGDAYHISDGKGSFGKTEINAVGDGVVFNGNTGVLNFGMGEQVQIPGVGTDASLAIGSEASIRSEMTAIVFDGPANSYTLIADGAQVSGQEGLYKGTGGNSTLELAQNAHVTGSISMGEGSDSLLLHKNVDLSRVTVIDGGDDLSGADGFVDTITFKDFSSTISSDKLLNWEKVVIDGGSLAFSNNSLITGAEVGSGLFIVNGGMHQAGTNFALQGNLNVGPDGTFQAQGAGYGVFRVSGDVYHEGNVSLGNSGVGDVFQIAGNYHGQGGTFVIDTVLAADGADSDKIHIQGDSSGAANLQVFNRGGLGEHTVADGIRVVQIDGLSNAAFTLKGDYVHEGEPVVVGGAYAYRLRQGGRANPDDGHWYLRSELLPEGSSVEPGPPAYQAGVPVYEAYPQFLLGLSDLPTLQQRVGNRFWGNSSGGNNSLITSEGQWTSLVDEEGLWGRIEGSHFKFKPRSSTSDTDYEYDSTKLQVGFDKLLSENENWKVIGGLTAHYIRGTADIHSKHGNGRIKTDGYGIGATLTWYGANNFYIDNQAHYTWYESDLRSRTADQTLVSNNKGHGYSLSTEVGKHFTLNDDWALTPQAQLTYSRTGFDNFEDSFESNISNGKAHNMQARLGISVDYQNAWLGEDGKNRRNTVYGVVNYMNDLMHKSEVDVSEVEISRKNDRQWLGVGLGGTYNWNNDRYSLYGEVSARTSLKNFGKSHGVRGVVGVRVHW